VRGSLALAWVSFAFLALGASPAHYWLDAGEITAAGTELGVIHPPGAPGLVPLLHLGALLPIGSLGFRLSLLSCAFATAAIVLVERVLARRDVHWLIPWGMAAWVLAGTTFVRNARVVEIYAFGAAAMMAFVWGFDPAVPPERRLSRRLLGTAAAVIGVWGFGDLRLALVPIVVVAWVLALRRREPWARWAPLVVAASSVVVIGLPLASAHGPIADWGNPESFSALWSHLMAEPIRAAFADEILPTGRAAWGLNFGAAFDRVVDDHGPFGPVVVVAGVLTWALRGNDRGLLLVLVLLIGVELFYTVGINPMGIRDRQTGFVLGLLGALVVGASLQAWTQERPRLRWAVFPLAFTGLALPALAISVPDLSTTRSWMPHAWTRGALAQLPPGTTVLTQSDDLAAGTLHARAVEGARPDLVIVPGQHLHKGGPDRPGPREAQVWEAASKGDDETGRIVDVLTHPPRPPAAIALEHPGVGVFARVPFAGSRGDPPMSFGGPGSKASPNDDLAARLDRSFETWGPRAESAADRRRLARSIDLTLRASLSANAADPDFLALAESNYLRVLSEVDGDDVGAHLALGAIHDATGRTASAIRHARRALEIEPGRNAALLTLALYLSRDPETQAEAVEVAERAVALRPHQSQNWRRLAQVAEQAGDAERAQQAHDIANDLSGREPSGT
jgi:hypothetical protein